MRVQLACVVLLFLVNDGTCSDAEEMGRTMKEELLSLIFTSKVSKQTLRFWEEMLRQACRQRGRWSGLPSERPWSQKQFQLLLEALEGQHSVRSLCELLHPWEHIQSGPENLDPEKTEKSVDQLKRKSPYILKRRMLRGKPRRPYILKRSGLY